MKKRYLTDKQAASALFTTAMGVAAENAQLKKKVREYRGRLLLVEHLLRASLDGLAGERSRKVHFGRKGQGDDVDIVDLRRALNVRIRNWKLEV